MPAVEVFGRSPGGNGQMLSCRERAREALILDEHFGRVPETGPGLSGLIRPPCLCYNALLEIERSTSLCGADEAAPA